jgi:hypothetical protein
MQGKACYSKIEFPFFVLCLKSKQTKIFGFKIFEFFFTVYFFDDPDLCFTVYCLNQNSDLLKFFTLSYIVPEI